MARMLNDKSCVISVLHTTLVPYTTYIVQTLYVETYWDGDVSYSRSDIEFDM